MLDVQLNDKLLEISETMGIVKTMIYPTEYAHGFVLGTLFLYF